MKRAGVLVGAALLLALTGCTQTTDVDAAPEASETAAPLVAETAPAEGADGEQAYLEQVRRDLPADTVIPDASDEQLLDAGKRACEEIASGADTMTLSLIEGEEANGLGYYDDSSVIIGSARALLCD